MKTYYQFINEVNNYEETSWSRTIDGELVTIKISEIEKYLEYFPIIEIPVSEIKDMCVHKDKKDEETIKRVESADLKYPIIISKDLKGEYNMILDGHHRLQKAINNNVEKIKAKVLDLKQAERIYQIMFTQK
jgi:hypothetical protein